MRFLRLAACAVVLVVIAGCGETAHEVSPASTPPPVTEVSQHGLFVALPAGWQAAPSSLTPHLTDPREELAVATFPLRYHEGGCAHMPVSALQDLGPRDAFVTLQERGIGATENGFPARPGHFGPALGGTSEAQQCTPSGRFGDHWFTFRDAGRFFHVLVAFGPDVPADVRTRAWAILDSLRVDPAVVPDWHSAG